LSLIFVRGGRKEVRADEPYLDFSIPPMKGVSGCPWFWADTVKRAGSRTVWLDRRLSSF